MLKGKANRLKGHKTIAGASRRLKGHNWERKVAQDLHSIDPTAKRALEYQQGLGYDIDTYLPYAIQCKSQKRVNWLSALKEADNIQGKHPIVAGKVTHEGEFAFMKWSTFLMLIRKIHIKV